MISIELFTSLRKAIEIYTPISNETWNELLQISKLKTVKKSDYPCRFGDIAQDFLFIGEGLIRAYILDERGHEYNKNFFLENNFAGSTVSLLKQEPSYFELEALEDSKVIFINYKKFRELIMRRDDLKLFYIYYLEDNWILKKEPREVALVQKSATERYEIFLEKYPTLETRVPQYLIASHLGITPTQLSRIRKSKY